MHTNSEEAHFRTSKIIFVSNKSVVESQNKIKELESKSSNDIILTCIDQSASKNRNYGLSQLEGEDRYVIMIDDDIEGFYDGWDIDLLTPLFEDETIMCVSARLIRNNGRYAPMMNDNHIYDPGAYNVRKSSYRGYMRPPTACIGLRVEYLKDIKFDENFIGSGYEDTDFFNKLNAAYPEKRIVINNNCKVIHHNEEKNQGGKYFEHNKRYYLSLYPKDTTVINQEDWTQQ